MSSETTACRLENHPSVAFSCLPHLYLFTKEIEFSQGSGLDTEPVIEYVCPLGIPLPRSKPSTLKPSMVCFIPSLPTSNLPRPNACQFHPPRGGSGLSWPVPCRLGLRFLVHRGFWVCKGILGLVGLGFRRLELKRWSWRLGAIALRVLGSGV